ARDGRPREFRIPVSLLAGNPTLRDETLAHESAHTLVIGNVSASRFRWINEAVAEGVGLQWMTKQGRPFPEIHPNFEMDLDLPFQMLYEPTWIREDLKFPKVFPAFVARYNNPTEEIEAGVGRFSEAVEEIGLTTIQVGTPFSEKPAIAQAKSF